MPLILGTNSIKDTGYNVANSLRFNDGSSDYLTKSFGTTQTSTAKFTVSVWVKRCTLGTRQSIFAAYDGTSAGGDDLEFETDDTLSYNGTGAGANTTSAKFRDPSAWLHIVLARDSSASGGSNQVKIYVNGTLQTLSANNGCNSSQFLKSGLNSRIGTNQGASQYWVDMYMAELCVIDGQMLDPTSFGEFDEDSPTTWKPKDVSGLTFGTNGFYLDFENASSLGADVSGNSNNFTVNNLTSLDQTTDTCTNNFATIDTLSTNLFDPATTTFSEGNLKYVASNANFNGTWLSNIGVNAGKWYAEFKLGSHSTNSGHSFGIYRYDDTGVNATGGDVPVSNMIRIIFADSSRNVIAFGSTVQTGLSSTSSGDIFGIYMDIDNGKLNVQKNGSDYITEITGITTAGSTFFFQTQGEVQSRNLTFEHNYGNPTFSISSGNSDPEGFGNFEFSTTHNSVDYFALCTKNLAEYG